MVLLFSFFTRTLLLSVWPYANISANSMLRSMLLPAYLGSNMCKEAYTRFLLKRQHLIREVIEIAAFIALFFVIVHFVVQNYLVGDPSMQPTFDKDAHVMVNKVAYLFHAPERGDVIVFHYPLNTNRDLIRRVIGLPGDTIQSDSNHIWVNGVLLSEPYVRTPANPTAKVWKVPANSYFVLSDNRTFNDDSRSWDYVAKEFIVGKAVVVYWPIGNLQLVNTYSETYSQLANSH